MVPRRLSAPRFRLLCFAHAGAGASVFFPWAAALAPEGIEVRAVQYPGRETRWGERLITSVAAMAAEMAERWPEMADSDGVPCACYGHSMGALVAYETTVRLERMMVSSSPRHLVLGARNAPSTPRSRPPIHQLADDDFLAAVADRYGNLPAALLEEPEMRELIVPVLKADFQLVDEYRWAPEAGPVVVPLTILHGSEDPWTTRDGLAAWARHTTMTYRKREIPGGHFFHQHAREDVWREIGAALTAADAAAG